MRDMSKWFRYNWAVREEWLDWCERLSTDELLRPRVGGAGGILATFVHILDVEYSWIRGMQGKSDVPIRLEAYASLQLVRELFALCRSEIEPFLDSSDTLKEDLPVHVPWTEGAHTQGEILRHLIAHEIHHIGQLSVWARELGLQPVSANVIGRKI